MDMGSGIFWTIVAAVVVGTVIGVILVKIFKSIILAVAAGMIAFLVITVAFGDGSAIVSAITSHMDEETRDSIRSGYEYYQSKRDSGTEAGILAGSPKQIADGAPGIQYGSNYVQVLFAEWVSSNDIASAAEMVDGKVITYLPQNHVYEILIEKTDIDGILSACRQLSDLPCVRSATYEKFANI